MRVDPAVFRQLDLRVHEFLSDVPLHDVWRVELAPRDGEPDMRDVRAVMSDALLVSLNPVVRGLFALRAFLGRLFRWDGERPARTTRSYARRLTDKDHERSLEPPGKVEGPFRLLYVFPTEALGEAINSTVHAFSCLALVPREGGYFLYWAIYVRPGKALTRFYMALIDPFRHWIVYPSILRHVQEAWRAPVRPISGCA
ncbi:MAG: DUF2867 domain-containing protein [Myxococcales bacterium]|nr:DUF2867 domain-containing protein [Myxococcales bacterium]MDH3482965.1 DUF2867 domain-containing protein [Myxococcales bacterium]